MTSLAADQDPLRLLSHLMQLDQAAMEGYRIASESVEDSQYRSQLQAFRADHARHLRELGPLVRQLGGEPPAGGKIHLLAGMVRLPEGEGDEAILLALKNNEDGTGQAYRDALERAPDPARDVIARGAEDEKRHARWLAIALSQLEASGSYRGSGAATRPGTTPPPR